MSVGVVGLVLLAAVLHAGWNAVAAGIPNRIVGFGLINSAAAVLAVAVILLAGPPARDSWPYLAASGALHLVYNGLLMRTYSLGDFSQTYPIARGMSPLAVTVLAVIFVAESPSVWHLLAVLVICVGLVSLALSGRKSRGTGRAPGTRQHRLALTAAMVTGLCIASYTTVDGIGVRKSQLPGAYLGWLILIEALPLAVIFLVLRRRTLREDLRGVWWMGLLGGVGNISAYGLVLFAQTRAALGPVAALRETSIIFGAIIGAVFLGERFGRRRIVPAGIVVAGIALLELT